MANDNDIEKNDSQSMDTATDYIKALEEIKKNSVSRDDYNKLKEENKMLLDAVVNNIPGGEEEEVVVDQPVDIDKLREDLFSVDNQDITNLDYITKAMKLRKALMDKGERDPFLPVGQNILPTDEDIKTAERVAEAYQHCIDVADGNPDVFTQELQRITVDAVPTRRR